MVRWGVGEGLLDGELFEIKEQQSWTFWEGGSCSVILFTEPPSKASDINDTRYKIKINLMTAPVSVKRRQCILHKVSNIYPTAIVADNDRLPYLVSSIIASSELSCMMLFWFDVIIKLCRRSHLYVWSSTASNAIGPMVQIAECATCRCKLRRFDLLSCFV